MRYSKILEVGPIPPPYAGWGVRIQYVLEGLRQRQISCAAIDLGAGRKSARQGTETVESVWAYATKIVRYLWQGYRLHHHLNADSWKAYLLVLYGCVLSRFFLRPAVLTWHGGVPQRWFPKGRNIAADWGHWALLQLCSQIICNDEKIKQHLLAYRVRADKIVPIQAFSRQYLQYQQVELPESLNHFLESHTPRFFCYAYFRPEFHLETLLQGLKDLKTTFLEFGIVMVGFSKDSEKFREQIEAEGLSENVYFAGDLDRHQFLTLLQKADLTIRTPQRDGVSSSVLESLGLGVPVVAARNALRPESVFCYEAEDARDLANTVRRVMAMPPEQRRPPAPEIPDTVVDEIAVLVDAEHSTLQVA
ncbi:Glycosyltransferase [Planctomycetales bacterium 10988]|nr:Glycosyltransferase [Planctomycetales bacterium 10988]